MFLQNTMSNPFDSTNNTEQDEISLFLQQILLRSSSSSSSSPSALIKKPLQCSVLPCDHIVSENQEPEMGSFPGRAVVSGPCSGLNSSTSCWVPANVSSSYVGTFDNDPDEYDCESEEGIETLVEEAAQKRMASRNSSSKRSRAAEVHNLSEKRRRSRINEKMKALQNLIPNSNKTDKASMLDEAIEYLKQLQLQVQMLTLRNGLSLYPICLPGMLPPDQISQTRVDVCERSKSLTEKAILMEQDISANTLLSLQDNCPKQVPVADFSTILGSKPTFELESSFQNHFEPFQFSKSSAGVCRDELLSCQQPNNEWSPTTLAGHFGTRPSNLKDHTIEACLGRGGADKLTNLLHNTIFSSQLKSSNNGVRPPFDDIKTEGDGF